MLDDRLYLRYFLEEPVIEALLSAQLTGGGVENKILRAFVRC